MASSMYDTGRNAFARGDFSWKSGVATWRCSLIDSTYTGSTANSLYSDVSAKLVGTTGAMTPADPVAGVCDATDQTFTAVSGNAVTQIVIYVLGTVNSLLNPLMCWIEFSSVTPNGGDITIQFDNGSNKIMKL